MAQPDVVQSLGALGFNLNEGRAYGALLHGGPSTGYEVSQRSQVPRSAVYGVLRRLVALGAARAIAGNPERFVATPVDTLIGLLHKRFEASSEALHQAAAELAATPTVPDAFSVRGHARVLEEAARLAHSAERSLVLSGWPRELRTLARELGAAQRRKVYLVVFSHAKLPSTLAGVHFSYGLEERALEAFWKHRLVMVADDRRTLIGAAEQSANDVAVMSETPAIAELATGQVALDITLLAQRCDHDVTAVMAKMLGDRVGRLDSLLGARHQPSLGEEHLPGDDA
jgi:sugar-specific transcriptional regulator TrmB